jgi:hypothetical protein
MQKFGSLPLDIYIFSLALSWLARAETTSETITFRMSLLLLLVMKKNTLTMGAVTEISVWTTVRSQVDPRYTQKVRRAKNGSEAEGIGRGGSRWVFSIRPLDHPKLNARQQKPKLKETQDEQYPLISRQSPLELAEYLAEFQAKSFSRLSRIELEDIRIPGECGPQRILIKSQWIDTQPESAIIDTSPWVAEKTLDSLPDFIAKGRTPTKNTKAWD